MAKVFADAAQRNVELKKKYASSHNTNALITSLIVANPLSAFPNLS